MGTESKDIHKHEEEVGSLKYLEAILSKDVNSTQDIEISIFAKKQSISKKVTEPRSHNK